jgi:hypothetical protein
MTETHPNRTTWGEFLEELIDLSVGVGVVGMPFLLLAVPGIILFVVLPALLLAAVAAPFAILGAIAAAPFLLLRAIRRRRSGQAGSSRPRAGRVRAASTATISARPATTLPKISKVETRPRGVTTRPATTAGIESEA